MKRFEFIKSAMIVPLVIASPMLAIKTIDERDMRILLDKINQLIAGHIQAVARFTDGYYTPDPLPEGVYEIKRWLETQLGYGKT